ncbi:MAG: serpin family protein [Oscillospiraceae bacterium]|nr:serpin family protein [Oscillospiraceae bacterium]
MKTKKLLSALICLFLIAGLITSSSVAVTGTTTTKTVSKQTKNGFLKPDKKFKKSQADFAVNLFKNTLKKGTNTLISPQSVMYALAMTANGAKGKTQKEMEKVLGNGMSIGKLNKYLGYTMDKLPKSKKCKVNIANSIWYDSNLSDTLIKKAFLKKNKKYYKATAFDVPFSSSDTVDKINNWCSENTDDMIKKILNNVDDDTRMILVNAISFDAKWQTCYQEYDVEKKNFTNYNGKKHKVEMLNGTEYNYLSDKKAKGFIKPYSGGRYAFAALLPNKGVDIYKYAKSLTGDKLRKILNSASNGNFMTAIPKFKYEYEKKLNKSLDKMGMKKAFDKDKANFRNMASFNPAYNLFINKVCHKTYIELNENGTRAGAVTSVTMDMASCIFTKPDVILNRPFIYMVLDTKTNLPVFIGTVVDL